MLEIIVISNKKAVWSLYKVTKRKNILFNELTNKWKQDMIIKVSLG